MVVVHFANKNNIELIMNVFLVKMVKYTILINKYANAMLQIINFGI